jgi:hypothetical protein
MGNRIDQETQAKRGRPDPSKKARVALNATKKYVMLQKLGLQKVKGFIVNNKEHHEMQFYNKQGFYTMPKNWC